MMLSADVSRFGSNAWSAINERTRYSVKWAVFLIAKFVTHSYGKPHARKTPWTQSMTARLKDPLPSPATSELPQMKQMKSTTRASQGGLTLVRRSRMREDTPYASAS